MTNDELLEDLKQFITSTVSQTEENLRLDLASKDDLKSLETSLKTDIKRVENKIDDGFAGIADTLDNAIIPVLDDHEVQLKKLKQQAA
jgi:vacuolar-type H+-ATPase subunit E/Vma4